MTVMMIVIVEVVGEVMVIISSEGALVAITPYDYPARPLFEDTPVLDNNFSIICHEDYYDH